MFIGYAILTTGQVLGLTSVVQLSFLSIVFGFNYFSQPPLFVLYGAQIAFPVDQPSVAGYLISIAQTFGFALGLVMVNLVSGSRENIMILFSVLGTLMLVGSLLSLTVEEDLRKERFEAPLLNDYTPWAEPDSADMVNSMVTDGD